MYWLNFFYSFSTNEFLLGIIHQKIRTRLVKVFLHVLVFGSCFIGHEWGGPDLAVGVRVGTSHYCTLVLKYLHPPENWRIGKVLWNIFKGYKTISYLYFCPRSLSSCTHASMTCLISSMDMMGTVTLDLGLKHITLQVPLACPHL